MIKTRLGTSLNSNVLALNRGYLAIHVVSARRAFCLLCKGLAEVISIEDDSYYSYDFSSWREVSELKIQLDEVQESEEWIQAVNFLIQVPRVIRLLHYDRIPRNSVKFSRRNIFLRDEHRCQYCARQFGTPQLSLDHVLPRSRGGKTTWENIVCACRKCNIRKGGRTPREAGMHLHNEPKKPKRNPVLSHQINSSKYSVWKRFVR